jgi:hypothetical protein
MTGQRQSGRALAVGPAVSLGLLLLLWAATTGPARVLSPSGRRHTFGTPFQPEAVTTSAAPRNLEELTKDVRQTHDLSWFGDLLAWAILLGFVFGVVLLARFAWRRRPRRPEAPPEVDFDVLPAARVAKALSEDLDAQLDAVAGGTPRNGIVRCWLRLEQSVAEAGLPPQRFETAAEFTVRVLHRLDLDPRAIGRLAGLYREARFSEHELGEDARTAARSALEQLHEDLRRVGAGR